MMDNVKLLMDEEFQSDVVLIAAADGMRIPAHRLILSAASGFFKRMFTVSMREAKEREVTINDIDGITLQTLVTYCYNGNLNLTDDNVEKILSTAHFMQIIPIIDKCAEFLHKQLSPSNCLGIHFIAAQFNCSKLEFAALNFIYVNFNQVTKGEEFLELNVDQLSSILSQDDLNVQQEEDVFESLMSWVKHDEANRKKDIPKLLLNVRMPLMNAEFMATQVGSVCEANGCSELFKEALEWKSVPDAFPAIDSKLITPRYMSGANLLTLTWSGFEKYCPKLNQWTPMQEMDLNQRHSSFTEWNQKLVIVDGRMKNVKYWDAKLKSYKDLSPLNTPRYGIKLAVFGESLYAIGGAAHGTVNNTVERLDSLTGSWRTLSPKPASGSPTASVVFDGHLYLACYETKLMLRYEPNADDWVKLNLKTDLKHFFVVNNQLYGMVWTGEIWSYNKDTGTWTRYDSKCSYVMAACTFNNRVFVVVHEKQKLLLKEYKVLDKMWIGLAPLCADHIKHIDFLALISIQSSAISLN